MINKENLCPDCMTVYISNEQKEKYGICSACLKRKNFSNYKNIPYKKLKDIPLNERMNKLKDELTKQDNFGLTEKHIKFIEDTYNESETKDIHEMIEVLTKKTKTFKKKEKREAVVNYLNRKYHKNYVYESRTKNFNYDYYKNKIKLSDDEIKIFTEVYKKYKTKEITAKEAGNIIGSNNFYYSIRSTKYKDLVSKIDNEDNTLIEDKKVNEFNKLKNIFKKYKIKEHEFVNDYIDWIEGEILISDIVKKYNLKYSYVFHDIINIIDKYKDIFNRYNNEEKEEKRRMLKVNTIINKNKEYQEKLKEKENKKQNNISLFSKGYGFDFTNSIKENKDQINIENLEENKNKEIYEDQHKKISESLLFSKNCGLSIGRPIIGFPNNFEEEYNKWKTGEQTANETMNNMNLKRTTFYALVNKYENGRVTKDVVSQEYLKSIKDEVDEVFNNKCESLNCKVEQEYTTKEYIQAFEVISNLLKNKDTICKNLINQLDIAEWYRRDINHEIELTEPEIGNSYFQDKLHILDKKRRKIKYNYEDITSIYTQLNLINEIEVNKALKILKEKEENRKIDKYVPRVDNTMVDKYEWAINPSLSSKVVNTPILTTNKELKQAKSGNKYHFRVKAEFWGWKGHAFYNEYVDCESKTEEKAKEEAIKYFDKLKEDNKSSSIYMIQDIFRIN